VLKIISLHVNALLCTLQHIVIHAMQLSGVNSPNFSPMYSLQQRIAIVEAYVCTDSIKETPDILQASFLALAYQQRVVYKIWWKGGVQQDQLQTRKRIEPRPFVRLLWSRIFKQGRSEALPNRHENCRNKRMFRLGLVNLCCSFYRWSPIEWHVSKNWGRKRRQNACIIARGFFKQLWVDCWIPCCISWVMKPGSICQDM
jgi:hypothetical protein